MTINWERNIMPQTRPLERSFYDTKKYKLVVLQYSLDFAILLTYTFHIIDNWEAIVFVSIQNIIDIFGFIP